MANGTDNPFAPGFGYGFDKPISSAASGVMKYMNLIPYGAPEQQASTYNPNWSPLGNPIEFPFLDGGGAATPPMVRDNYEVSSIPMMKAKSLAAATLDEPIQIQKAVLPPRDRKSTV